MNASLRDTKSALSTSFVFSMQFYVELYIPALSLSIFFWDKIIIHFFNYMNLIIYIICQKSLYICAKKIHTHKNITDSCRR